MTVLFGEHAHLCKFQFGAPKNDTERVRERTITDQVRHDLSAATRRQIPIFLSAVLPIRAAENTRQRLSRIRVATPVEMYCPATVVPMALLRILSSSRWDAPEAFIRLYRSSSVSSSSFS